MPTPPENTPLRWSTQTLEHVTPWSPTLWSIRISKPASFHFKPGHYARLGLEVAGGETVWRPYSFVSAPAENFLEFLVTLIPDGQFTGRLATLPVPSPILLDSAAMGFFLPSQLAQGDSLWLLATGAGLGPYISILREAQILRDYAQIVLVHSVRLVSELAYRQEIEAIAAQHAGLHYLPIVTKQAGATPLAQRIPELIHNAALETASGIKLEASSARVMVCGNPAFTADMRQTLSQRGFQPCRRGLIGSMLFEKYW